jgi:MoxR-like ATPase
LPEAQLDRFLMHIRIGYPDAGSERAILALARRQAGAAAVGERAAATTVLLTQEQIFSARQAVLAQHMAPAVEEYLIQLLLASRDPAPYGDDLARWVSYGASPRGTIALDRCARARAWLLGRDYVTPEDVQAVAHDTLRHRILLSFEAEAEGLTSDDVITTLIKRVPVS